VVEGTEEVVFLGGTSDNHRATFRLCVTKYPTFQQRQTDARLGGYDDVAPHNVAEEARACGDMRDVNSNECDITAR
jgi:hypothetical protein